MSSASRLRALFVNHRQSKLRRDSRRRMFFESLEGRSLLAGADAFASAPLIPNVAVFSDPTDTTTFTMEAGEPATTLAGPPVGQTSAWWKVQVPTTGIVTITTYETHYPLDQCCGAGFQGFGDTTLEVFTGTGLNDLVLLTNNDDITALNGGDAAYPYPGAAPAGYNPNSLVSFTATSGTTYYVRLNGWGDDFGTDPAGGGDRGSTSFTYSYSSDLYVDDGFAGMTNGQVIADADQGTTGAQPATFGINAFATINDALTASAANGTIIVNGGTYGEAVALAGTRTLKIGGANAAQAVAVNSISAVAGTTINLAGSSTLSVGDASNMTISGLINGSGNLTKTGSGTLTLDNANTYTGATAISAGVLRTGGHQAYQITTNTTANQFYGGSLGYDFTVGAGKSVTVTQLGFYDANPSGLTNAHNVYISSNNGATLFATGVVPAGTTAPLVSGYRFVNLATPVTLGPGTYRVWGDNYGVDGDFNSGGGAGPTDGGGSNELTFVGNSFFGASNAFPTNGDGGPAYRYGAASFNFTTQVLPAGTAVTIAAGASLDLANSNQTIGSLSGVGGSAVTLGAGTLTVAGSASTAYSGNISGAGGLTKNGTGTLTLSGNNSYDGATNINAGMLIAASNSALGSAVGNTRVANAATLGLSGNVTIAEPIAAAGNGSGQGAIRSITGNNTLNGAITMSPISAVGPTTPVALTSATAAASYSQGGFSPKQMIDGDVTVTAGGWANSGNPGGSNAVFETAANVNPGGVPTELTFSIFSGGYGNHTIGRFKVYVTTDDRANFANGADNGGQIGSNWVELAPVSATSVNGTTLSILSDNSIRASGTDPSTDTFTIKGVTSLANITGIRIETIKDAALPSSGPGRASNGNYVIIEWNIASAVADTSSLTIGSSEAGSTLTINGLINNPVANGTVTFVGNGNVSLGSTGGISQASGATNVVKSSFGTLTNAGANNNFAGTLSVNNGMYVAASNSAFGTTAGGTSTGADGSIGFTGGITVGAEALSVTGSINDALINLGGTNNFGGSISVVPFTNSGASPVIGSFTGGDAGEGLDLTGTFPYAVNMRGPAVGPVQGASFTTSEGGTPGLTFSAPNEIINWHNPNYGNTTSDNNLEIVMQSIRWNGGPVTMDMANVIPGHVYKLQLLYAEACCSRGFDVSVEGVPVAPDFAPFQQQGGINNTAQGAVITYQFVAGDSIVNVVQQGPAPFADNNPIINGFTLEDLGPGTVRDLGIRSDSGTLVLNGAVNLNSSVLNVRGASNVTINGAIGQTGASSLLKSGAGTLTLTNANTYSGGTTISQGTVVVQNNGALDGGAVTLNDANTGSSNTALLITNPTSAVITIPNNITVANFGSGTSSIGSTTFNVGPFASVYTGTLTLNKATSLTGGNSDRTTYTNVISGNVGTLTVTGGARTTIEANNTFVGNVNVTTSGTTLQVGGPAASQIPDASNVDLAAGTFLTLNNDPEAINGLTGSGTVQNIVGGNTLTLGAGAGGTFVFSGAFNNGSGALSLTKTGNSIQYLDGASGYTGVTNINGGYLVVRNNAALGSTAGGTVVVNPGTLQLESTTGISIGAEPLTISGFGVGGTRGALASWSGTNSFAGNISIAGDASTFVNSGQLTLTGVISGSSTFSNRKIGAGDLVYAGGSTNTFAGTTILDQGNLYLGKTGGAFAISGPMQMGGGNTNQPNLRMQQTNQFAPGVVMSLGAGQNPHARFDLQGFDQTLAGLVSPTSFLVVQNERLGGGGTTQGATLTLNGSSTYVFNGGFIRDEDDAGTTFKLSLVKTGSGTQVLGGNNINYTGTTTVNDGVLQLVDARNFRSPLAVNGTGVLDINSSVPFATRWNYAQAITGNGTIKKTGTGVFGITGVNNFAGSLLIQQGTLHNDNLTANWNGSTADVDISNGAFLDLRGNNITIDALTGTGGVINSYGNGTNVLTVGAANAIATFDGTISGSGSGAGGEGNGRTALAKIGTGAQTLTNASTYIAGTTISNGALVANNASGSATGPGAVNVTTNGTLGGNGFIGGAVTVMGKIDAGNVGAIGKLTINNNLTISAGGALVAQLTAPTTPGTTYDQIVVTGDVNVTGATLSAAHSSSAALGDLFTLIKNDGPNPTVGQFAGLAADPSHPLLSDQIATISGQRYYVTYNDPAARFGTGNDVAVMRNRIVTAVNDPLGSILRNTSVSGNVRTNDIDADHDGIMTITSPVAHGTLTIDLVTGAFTYKPATDYVGADSFTYRLFDGEFESFGVVTVDVTPAVLQAGTLYIAGTVNADRITIQPANFGGNVSFRYNNILFGPFNVTNQVVVFGLGGPDNMTVTGNVAVPVAFYGGEGNDYLAGGNLNDVLDGGSGVDRLLGGSGDDTLYGGADNDTLSGGNNNDFLDGDSYTDIPTVITGGNLASLIGAILLPPAASQGKDTIGGDNGEDRLFGRGGDDTLNGGNDNDVMDGEAGNDKMDGGSGDDLMQGGTGGDTLYGRAGADVLVGGADADILYGATGADLMFGDNVSNPAALAAIMATWVSSDYSGAANALKAIAVSDNALDTLHGEGDADWYLMYINDKLKLASEGKAPNVVVNLP